MVKKTASSPAEFCDVVWNGVLDSACLGVVVKATQITSSPPKSVEEAIELFRLPREVITEAIDFTEQNSRACLLSRKRFPSTPVLDPWDKKRKTALEASVCRGISRIARLAQAHWGWSKRHAAVSQSAAVLELLSEVASRWEEGQRVYHEALQNGNASTSLPSVSPKAAKKKERRRKRHDTTDERLNKLASSVEGRQAILAAGTSERIGKLIDRSHAAVAGSPVWKKKVKPLLDAEKMERQLARIELDERRQDRRKTD